MASLLIVTAAALLFFINLDHLCLFDRSSHTALASKGWSLLLNLEDSESKLRSLIVWICLISSPSLSFKWLSVAIKVKLSDFFPGLGLVRGMTVHFYDSLACLFIILLLPPCFLVDHKDLHVN
jgi:hypothetical protein